MRSTLSTQRVLLVKSSDQVFAMPVNSVQRVKEIASKYEGKLSFKYSGPWPPYNFVHIRLKLERVEGSTEAVAS